MHNSIKYSLPPPVLILLLSFLFFTFFLSLIFIGFQRLTFHISLANGLIDIFSVIYHALNLSVATSKHHGYAGDIRKAPAIPANIICLHPNVTCNLLLPRHSGLYLGQIFESYWKNITKNTPVHHDLRFNYRFYSGIFQKCEILYISYPQGFWVPHVQKRELKCSVHGSPQYSACTPLSDL